MAMATANCTCKVCGKEYTVTIKRASRREADSAAEYIQRSNDHLCSSCYKQQQQCKAAEAAKKAAEAAKKMEDSLNFPALVGSDKQVAWAKSIRLDVRKSIMHGGNCTWRGLPLPEDTEALKNIVIEIQSFFSAETSAKVYIDNRNNTTQQWFDLIAAALDAAATQAAAVEEAEEEAEESAPVTCKRIATASEMTRALTSEKWAEGLDWGPTAEEIESDKELDRWWESIGGETTAKFNREIIARNLAEMAHDITSYHALEYARYDLLVLENLDVICGDLHIDCNSWTRWHKKNNVLAHLSIHPIYTTYHWQYPITDEQQALLDSAAASCISQWANETAAAIVDGQTDLETLELIPYTDLMLDTMQDMQDAQEVV